MAKRGKKRKGKKKSGKQIVAAFQKSASKIVKAGKKSKQRSDQKPMELLKQQLRKKKGYVESLTKLIEKRGG